jgi:hypothetical protein
LKDTRDKNPGIPLSMPELLTVAKKNPGFITDDELIIADVSVVRD